MKKYLKILAFSTAVGGTSSLLLQCGLQSSMESSRSNPLDFQNFNLAGRSIGLEGKEIALTLDDGPGYRTAELANWLRDNDVPVTFFMVGNAAQSQIGTVQKISKMNFDDGTRAFIVANHSMTHTLAMPDTDVVSEVKRADNVLNPYMDPSRQPFLFRAPYGDFTRGGSGMVSHLNNSGDLAKYIGPIFWNIGGELTSRYSADWDCWNRGVSVNSCMDGYINETIDTNGGIMLAHDVHSKTVDMLMGTNNNGSNPAGRSLIRELRARGFKFVAIDKNPNKLAEYGTVPQNMFGDVSFASTRLGGNQVEFRIQAPNADRMEVWIDRYNRPLFSEDVYDGVEKIYSRSFSVTGRRTMTVKAYRNNKLIALRIYQFEI